MGCPVRDVQGPVMPVELGPMPGSWSADDVLEDAIGPRRAFGPWKRYGRFWTITIPDTSAQYDVNMATSKSGAEWLHHIADKNWVTDEVLGALVRGMLAYGEL
jgi:hypothetical protein